MSLDVKFSPLARDDLESIYSFISPTNSQAQGRQKQPLVRFWIGLASLLDFPNPALPYPQFTQSKASIATFVREIILRFTVRQTQSTSTVSSMQKATI